MVKLESDATDGDQWREQNIGVDIHIKAGQEFVGVSGTTGGS